MSAMGAQSVLPAGDDAKVEANVAAPVIEEKEDVDMTGLFGNSDDEY